MSLLKKIYALDLETFRIRSGLAAPKGVCLSYDKGDGDVGVVLIDEGVKLFRQWVSDKNIILVGHVITYDLCILAAEDETLLPLIFEALEDNRIRCTKVREKILHNAIGELKYEWDEDLQQYKKSDYTLQRIVKNRANKFLPKEETWRLRYCELHGVPISQWPPEAIKYAIDDSIWARWIYLEQEKDIAELCKKFEIADGLLPGENQVTRTDFVLGTLRSWGVRTDEESVVALKKDLQEKYDWWVIEAQRLRMIRGEDRFGKCTRDMTAIKARVVESYTQLGLEIPMSDSGKNISTSRETLTFGKYPAAPRTKAWEDQETLCVDPALQSVAEVVKYQKLLTTYVPILERGIIFPLTPSWNSMVESYRISCAAPNLTNQGRDGSVRRCFIPRTGHIYAFADYSTLEMRTLAQLCIVLFKYSFLAEAIRAGKDLHIDLAASELLGASYEETLARYEANDKVIENIRDLAKVANFGCAGGMGADSFVDYARGMGVVVTPEQSKQLVSAFRSKWKEMNDYFNHCSNMLSGDEVEFAVHPITGMIRGKVRYTAYANHGFQHLAAVGATAALYQVVKETLVPDAQGKYSALYGSRVWGFIHDEIDMEIPAHILGPEKTHKAAMRLQEVMIAEMSKWCPDVPIGATVAMARRWLKSAKPVYNADGFLVPAKKVGKEWVHDTGEPEQEHARAA